MNFILFGLSSSLIGFKIKKPVISHYIIMASVFFSKGSFVSLQIIKTVNYNT
jgi:hypothetical protein